MLAPPAIVAPQGLQARLARKAVMDLLALRVTLVPKGQPAQLDLKGLKGLKV
jgi:hypothetical protein